MNLQSLDGVHAHRFMQICTEVNADHADKADALCWPLWHEPIMGLSSKIKDWLVKTYPNKSELGRLADVGASQISRLYKGQNVGYEQVASILEAVGAKIVFPGERQDFSRDVCWVDAKIVPAGEGQKLPHPENYFAVPLVGEAGAGPGIMPTEDIKSWVLVYRHQHAVRFKRNLLAVEIDKGSTSMLPLLRPGDIVLVDRDDFRPDKPGGIFLVREPGQDGGAMVKRVAAKQDNGDTLVTFYSDNAAENPPDTYSLKAHYDGDISRAIVGRCIWSWADLSGK